MRKCLVIVILLFPFVSSGQQGNSVAYKDSTATNFFRRTSGVIAMDGGYSVPLSDNRVLWLFGDSYIDHYDTATGTVPCLFQVRNSALLQPFGNWKWQQTNTLLSKGPGIKSFLKNKPDGTYFIWPGDGVQLGDTVYVFCHNMQNTGKGMGFAKGGPDAWAKIKFPEMKVVAYTTLQDFGNINFGHSFIKDDSNGYVYAYGMGQAKNSLANDLYIARFPANDPGAPWTFWTGAAWDKDIKKIKPVGDVPAYSLQVSRVKQKYLLLSADFSLACDQGRNIYAAVSDRPEGPFTERKIIYTIADTVNGHYPFFYLPAAHPEYINQKNELLVTYCINGYSPCIANCVNNRFNPEYYRPQAIRVPLKLIDPDL